MSSMTDIAQATSAAPVNLPPPRQTDRGREFISGHPLRRLVADGRPAVAVKVRLTSYRSLPLSCVERIGLTVDGREIDPSAMRLLLNAHEYRLDELGRHSTVWWFILDLAELIVTGEAPLEAGEHLVEGTLVTVEPYVSNGRFHFTSTATRRLVLEPSDFAGTTR